ncbi:GTP cyclohydrolase ii [Colletotrichum tofieldiae]|nr:GTP cyclohydrolase ii [Colletotrichum tofieldiae]
MSGPTSNDGCLAEVLSSLKSIQQTQSDLVAAVESLNHRYQQLAGDTDVAALGPGSSLGEAPDRPRTPRRSETGAVGDLAQSSSSDLTLQAPAVPSSPSQRSGLTSRIILTTYPKQIGINPLPMKWGELDPHTRGPVVVSRSSTTIGKRNGLTLPTRSLPPISVRSLNGVTQRRSSRWTLGVIWLRGSSRTPLRSKMVRQSRPGHPCLLTNPWTKLQRYVPDGKVCLNNLGELAVTKFAVEPVWYLPGVAERFGIDEGALRRSLFEHTGGSYPELITRNDIKVFLPPIGGYTKAIRCLEQSKKMD